MKHLFSKRSALAALVLTAAVPGVAHVVLEHPVASGGIAYRATFKVGHGCAGSPTRQFVVHIPPGVRNARPMPKPGWTLEIAREKLARPYTSPGRTVTEDVVRVSWTARTAEDMLPNAHYDEFVLSAQMPQQGGTIYWPVNQLCEAGRIDWTELPRAGQPAGELKSPAAALEILPAAGTGSHKH